jgi:long-subunit acyl-CoA synthetase (AMP-forming)
VVTVGYLKDENLTARQYAADGSIPALGRFDQEGFCIVGRKKEMIKVGGGDCLEPEVESVY